MDLSAFSQPILSNIHKPKRDWSFETLRTDILSKGITSSGDYQKQAPVYRWPNRRDLVKRLEFPKTITGANNWPVFLNTGKEYKEKKNWTFENLQTDVREKGIKSAYCYQRDAATHRWPNYATLVRKPEFPRNPDGTNDWATFLNTGKSYEERKDWTFESLRADVRTKSIRSSTSYQKQAPMNGWPSHITLINKPEFPKNPNGSNDWASFLNTGKVYKERKVWSFESLHADILAKGIRSSSDYQKKAAVNSWPCLDTLRWNPEFPKRADGSNDWDTFLERKK